MTHSPPTLFCFGYGYSARHLAEKLRGEGWRIAATARSAEKVANLREAGIDAHLWPCDDFAAILPRNTHLLISASPDEAGDPLLSAERDALLAARDRLAWIGYLSTTSVYGDREGGEVDETTPPAPDSARGTRRAAAERDWLALAAEGLPVHIFRLAGIYGPGRGPFEKIRSDTARSIIKPGQVFGRIHVEDIANALCASIARPLPGRIYNVTDDLTCPPQDVLAYAAQLLGVAPPPEVDFENADLSPMARSFYAENKRVSNLRIRKELGVDLLYPTYREGLKAVLEKYNES